MVGLSGRLEAQIVRSIPENHVNIQSQKTAKASLGAEAEAKQLPRPRAKAKLAVAAEDGSEAVYKWW